MDGLLIVFTLWTVQRKLCQNCTKKANVEFSWRLKHKYNYLVEWFRSRLKDKPSIAYALPRSHYFYSLISFRFFFFFQFSLSSFRNIYLYWGVFLYNFHWCANTTTQKSFNSLTFQKQLDYVLHNRAFEYEDDYDTRNIHSVHAPLARVGTR